MFESFQDELRGGVFHWLAGLISSTSEDCGHYGNAVRDSNGGVPVQVSRQLPAEA